MKKILLAFSTFVFMTSCSNTDDNNSVNEDPQEEKPYANGIIVCNEGSFTRSNASASFINNDLTTITNGIYALSNSNAKLGDVAQSISFKDDLAYIVVNNSNVIEIVNRYTFKKVNQITENLKQPRYLAFSNGKIYVSNAQNNSLTVYNEKTYAFEKVIKLDYKPEKVVTSTNFVYVQSVSYASGNAVEIINSTTDENTLDLTFDLTMDGMVIDKNTQAVYVVASSADKSEISKIENNVIAKKISSTTVKSARNLTIENNNLYFTSSNGIYTVPTTLNSFPTASLFNVTNNTEFPWSTLYGFNVIDGKIYTSEAKGFTDNSEITIYNLSGTQLKTFTSQIGTNSFYKN